MENNKLVSMVEFVNYHQDKIKNAQAEGKTFSELLDFRQEAQLEIFNYSRFLSRPLTLGMFIPCDADGNILEEPQIHYTQTCFDEQSGDYDGQEVAEYISAKQRVLFEGFEVDSKTDFLLVLVNYTLNPKKYVYVTWHETRGVSLSFGEQIEHEPIKNIEGLIITGLALTPYALKQINQ